MEVDVLFDFSQTRLIRPQAEFPSDKNIYIYYTAEWNNTCGKEAELYFWSSGLSEIALNGECIHQGPCRDSLPLLYYDIIPLHNLKYGKNRISVKLNIEEIRNYEDASGEIREYAGILIEIKNENGRITPDMLEIKSGYSSAYLSDVPRNSGAGYSEVLISDAEDDWYSVKSELCDKKTVYGFEIPEDSLNQRSIPLFTYNEIKYSSVPLTEGDGSLLYDFGEMVFGRVTVKGRASGEVIIGYIEDLEHGWSNSEGRQEMYQDKVLGVKGDFYFKSFRKRAFRYLRVHGADRIDKLTVSEYGYPLKQLGEFESSDSFLNRLMSISCATLRINTDDIFNDCPHRDQSQWMDAYLSSRIMLALYGDTKLARKCLYQHAIGSFHNGIICSPSINGTVMFADYALILFDYVMWYYRVTGDRTVLSDLKVNLRTTLEYFLRFVDDSGLLRSAEELGLIYLDNTFELSRYEHSSALNALFYMAMKRFSELCEKLNDKKEAVIWEKHASDLRNSFFRIFSHHDINGCLRDSDTEYNSGYYMINFSCEFGSWHLPGAALEFCVDSEYDCNMELYVAEYAGFRVFLNGIECVDIPHKAGWDRQPCYDPIKINITLKKGANLIRWEVKANQLNFELFFRKSDNSSIDFYSPDGKKHGYAAIEKYDYECRCSLENAGRHEVRVRNWIPPLLSQSTHVYACLSEIFDSNESARQALLNVMPSEYIRTYLSVRVPYFCSEAGENREKDNWIMPVNTPWTGSFLLLALSKCGIADIGLEILRRFWGGMIEQNAVNTWEEWGNRSSLCHAWGATPAYFMLNQILGVEHCSDDGSEITVRPDLFDLKWARGYVAAGHDEKRIYVSLERAGDTTLVLIDIPEGIKAKIDLSRLKNPVLLK